MTENWRRIWFAAAVVAANIYSSMLVVPASSQSFRLRTGSNPVLLNLARKACTGIVLTTSPISKALGMDEPVYYFREPPRPVELLWISARNCPEPRPVSEFAVGHVIGGGQAYIYKISTETGAILEAVRSYPDLKDIEKTVFEVITPINQTGTPKVYPKNIQEDYDALIAAVIAKWGR